MASAAAQAYRTHRTLRDQKSRLARKVILRNTAQVMAAVRWPAIAPPKYTKPPIKKDEKNENKNNKKRKSRKETND